MKTYCVRMYGEDNEVEINDVISHHINDHGWLHFSGDDGVFAVFKEWVCFFEID